MDQLEKYINDLSTPQDALLRDLERETNLRVVQPRMLSGSVQGKFLEFLVRMTGARRVLEIGTFTGYSTLCMAAGLPEGGIIDTIEIDDELESLYSDFFERSSCRDKIRYHIGSALEIVPRFKEPFDLVFIDGDKREYPDYYRMLMGDHGNLPLVAGGSYMVADNILWYGKVVDTSIPAADRHTHAIREFNRIVAQDIRVENVILPLRDGLNLIRVK